mmetsp:Transcript_31873/g.52650  ORF Transcript_31873/g.52650 Transcript_31873/m.52650 type:complete len:141 (+) Transcript_31873:410-832(+)
MISGNVRTEQTFRHQTSWQICMTKETASPAAAMPLRDSTMHLPCKTHSGRECGAKRWRLQKYVHMCKGVSASAWNCRAISTKRVQAWIQRWKWPKRSIRVVHGHIWSMDLFEPASWSAACTYSAMAALSTKGGGPAPTPL